MYSFPSSVHAAICTRGRTKIVLDRSYFVLVYKVYEHFMHVEGINIYFILRRTIKIHSPSKIEKGKKFNQSLSANVFFTKSL